MAVVHLYSANIVDIVGDAPNVMTSNLCVSHAHHSISCVIIG